MLQIVRTWTERARLRRLERRGDVVTGWAESLRFFLQLSRDLIPGEEREISRDLFGLLAYTWAAQAGLGAYDPHQLLKSIRTRAWLGYADTPALVAMTRAELPHADSGRRMVAFFEELAEKRSTYLFLPVVSRIDCHQNGGGPLPIGALHLDGLADRYAETTHGRFARGSFVLAPQATRERDTFLLALMTVAWGKGRWVSSGPELLAAAAAQLRRLHETPAEAVAEVRADVSDPGPTGELAFEVVEIAEEVSTRAPWLWLETLFIVENWIAGPQWFAQAFEVEEATPLELLRRL